MVRKMIKFTLDIDIDIHDKISAIAKNEQRSTAAEYRIRLAKSLEYDKIISKLEKKIAVLEFQTGNTKNEQ
jgi:hypothetical protein